MYTARVSPKIDLNNGQRACLSCFSLVLGGVLFYFVFLPIQGHMGLNFIAAVEPYFQFSFYLRGLQVFFIFAGRLFFLPFYVYLGYRISRMLLFRTASALSGWKRNSRRQRTGSLSSVQLGDGVENETRLARVFSVLAEALNDSSQQLRGIFRRTHRKPSGFPGKFLWNVLRLLRGSLHFLWRGYMVLCVVLVSLEVLFFSLLIFRVAARPTGAITFFRTCDQCHGLNRPLNFNHTAAIWEITVDRMIRHAPVLDMPFPVDKRNDIIGFLCAIRSYSDRRLMLSKCYLCHTPMRLFGHPRTRAEWALIVDRIQRKNPFHITPRQAEQIVAHLCRRKKWTLEDPPRDSESMRELDIRVRFQEKCATCHTMDIVLMPHIQVDDWESILRRMSGKSPEFISPEESLSFFPLIESYLGHSETFYHAFPHSTMREKSHE